MKILLTILFSAITAHGYSQDTTAFSFTPTPPSKWSHYTIDFRNVSTKDSARTFAAKWSDGTVEIKGDTMLAVKILFERIEELQKDEIEKWEFIGASVEWINTVPDYWRNYKTNKQWRRFYKELKKYGFK